MHIKLSLSLSLNSASTQLHLGLSSALGVEVFLKMLPHWIKQIIISFHPLLKGDTLFILEYYPAGWIILEYHPAGWINRDEAELKLSLNSSLN